MRVTAMLSKGRMLEQKVGESMQARLNAMGRYQSAVLPEFWLNINWLWQEPLPSVRKILKEWETKTS
jgi:hypothetical protein